jgi:hypothetical protein
MFAILLHESMDPFYQNISSFPTVFFTLFLALALFYWVVAILGLVDIEILDFDIPDGQGGLHANPDTGLSNANVLAGLMLKLGLRGVPVTIILTLMSLIGWILCYYLVHFSFGWIPDGILEFLAGIPILVVSLYVSAMLTALLITPLRPLFRKATQETIKNVLGQTAIVRTSRVDEKFGEAVLEDGGAGLILKVRSTEGETFKSGDRVVLLEYLSEQNAYRIVSEETFRTGV